jgi:Sel1 repeat-containing protein
MPIVITGVAGLNNTTFASGETVPDPFTGTCATCHDMPNVGNHSVKAPLNIGVADAGRRTPDMPMYTLRRISTGQTVQTTDPGRAMIRGKWAGPEASARAVSRTQAARERPVHRALSWYRKAADQGHAGAMYNLGAMYFRGQGVAQVAEAQRRATDWKPPSQVASPAGSQHVFRFNVGVVEFETTTVREVTRSTPRAASGSPCEVHPEDGRRG